MSRFHIAVKVELKMCKKIATYCIKVNPTQADTAEEIGLCPVVEYTQN